MVEHSTDRDYLQLYCDAGVDRCRPYTTFATPPRHLRRNDHEEKLTHWLSGSVPWTATDPRDSNRDP
jgi:hypothetical protein